MSDANFSRRDFIKLTVVGAAAVAGTRLVKEAQASSSSPAGKHQWAMVIDQSKCTGCNYCTLACQAHNDTAPENQWNVVSEAGEVAGHKVFIARPCMQCAKAPCVEVCMVGASYYRDDGIVMMDYDKCIGCRYCEVACPYQARVFNWEKFEGKNPEKCSFCYHRIDRGLELGLTPGMDEDATPACVSACPTGARMFGDLNDKISLVSLVLKEHASYRLREDLATGPRVYYLPADPKEMEMEVKS